MARVQKNPPAPATIPLSCGLGVSAVEMSKLPVIEYRQSGVVLVDDRIKCSTKIGDQIVNHTITFSITREPIGNEEAAKVADVKDERKAAADAKEKAAQETLQREKQAMFTLGKESTSAALFDTLGQIDKLVQVGQLVNKMIPASKPA